jgi:hypothetical protein
MGVYSSRLSSNLQLVAPKKCTQVCTKYAKSAPFQKCIERENSPEGENGERLYTKNKYKKKMANFRHDGE